MKLKIKEPRHGNNKHVRFKEFNGEKGEVSEVHDQLEEINIIIFNAFYLKILPSISDNFDSKVNDCEFH